MNCPHCENSNKLIDSFLCRVAVKKTVKRQGACSWLGCSCTKVGGWLGRHVGAFPVFFCFLSLFLFQIPILVLLGVVLNLTCFFFFFFFFFFLSLPSSDSCLCFTQNGITSYVLFLRPLFSFSSSYPCFTRNGMATYILFSFFFICILQLLYMAALIWSVQWHDFPLPLRALRNEFIKYFSLISPPFRIVRHLSWTGSGGQLL